MEKQQPQYGSWRSWWRVREFRRPAVRIVFWSACAVLLSTLLPFAQRFLIDAVNDGARRRAWMAIGVLGAMVGALALCRALERRGRCRFAMTLRNVLKQDFFRRLLNLPEMFLRSRGVGYYFNRVQSDINETTAFFSSSGFLLISDLLKVGLALGVIFVLHWHYGVLLLPFLAGQFWVCYRFRRKQFRLSSRLLECTAGEQHLMQEFLANHTVLKTHAGIEPATARLQAGLNRWRKIAGLRIDHEMYFSFFLQLPMWLCCGGLTLWGIELVLDKLWTLGELWAMIALLMLVFNPVRGIGGRFLQMQAARAAWLRLDELGRSRPEENGGGRIVANLAGTLEIQNLTFGYEANQPVFSRFNLRVEPGETVFLTGANGSGKSTLIALLLRLYRANSGAIRVGGVPAEAFELASWRKHISYIGQPLQFPPGTLRENLLLGNPRSDDEIAKVLRRFELEDLVARNPAGLAARVAENGANYSAGERLRLALAREFLRDTDWILFDEAAANLDEDGRRKFFELLRENAGGKTMLVVTHDPPRDDPRARIVTLCR